MYTVKCLYLVDKWKFSKLELPLLRKNESISKQIKIYISKKTLFLKEKIMTTTDEFRTKSTQQAKVMKSTLQTIRALSRDMCFFRQDGLKTLILSRFEKMLHES